MMRFGSVFPYRRFASAAPAVLPAEPTVYLNPICFQMDQMIYKCADSDQLLSLIVTHRGVLFVHNLVTAMETLSVLATNPGGDRHSELAIRKVAKDDRLQILLRDLIEFAPKLDLNSIATVSSSLRALDYRYFPLFSGLLARLYLLMKEPGIDLLVLLKTGETFQWAGYSAAISLYKSLGSYLSNSFPDLSETDVVHALRLFGSLESFQKPVYQAAAIHLLERGRLASQSGENISVIASSFAAHRVAMNDAVILACADILANDPSRFKARDAITVLLALRSCNLAHAASVDASWDKLVLPIIDSAWRRREVADSLSTSEIADLVESSAFFGLGGIVRISKAMDYLSDHVDCISERGAVSILWALAVYPELAAAHVELFTLVARKVGSSDDWEKRKVQVFWLWISCRLDAPFISFPQMDREALGACLRSWLITRQGFGVPCKRHSAMLTQRLGLSGNGYWLEDSPFEFDAVLPGIKRCLLILPEFSRNTASLCGSSLLQANYARRRGWTVTALSPDQVESLVSLESLPSLTDRESLLLES